MRAPDQHRARAERQRLDDINPAPKAAVDKHRRFAADRLDNAGQRPDRGDRAVELAPAMIGDDDPVGAALHRLARLVRMQNAFEDERPAPKVAQPVDVMPADVRIELFEHQRAEGRHRGARAVIGEARRGRRAHPHEPARTAGEVHDAARAPPQGKGRAVARVAVAPRHHLVVDGEDEPVIAGRRGARGEFLGEASVLVEEGLHPFRALRRGADLLQARQRGMAGRIDRPEAGGGARSLDLGARPHEPGEAGRTDNDRRAELLAEQLDRLVARGCACEQRRNELHCGQRRLVARAW